MSELQYSIKYIAQILKGKAFLPNPNVCIENLLTDSRTLVSPAKSLFFAFSAKRNGHEFISHAYQNGVRNFVISDENYVEKYEEANFIVVDDVLKALQNIASFHRAQFNLQVVGITGSNGKTIVKEWLYQLLTADFNIVRSPKSFNSQIGVPLSVWQIAEVHSLGIFEAGISTSGEMQALAAVIHPTIGILTNIGEAHAAGFESKRHKLKEKLKLFEEVELFIYAPEYTSTLEISELPGKKKFSWSTKEPADLHIQHIETKKEESYIEASYQGAQISCTIPFTDKAALENAIICWATLLALDYSPAEASIRLDRLTGVNMRLALINGIENCSIIDDSYSADISSLAIALDFLNLQNQHPKRTLILSDLYETGKRTKDLYTEIAALLQQKKVDHLIGIGPDISAFANLFKLEASFYQNTQEFIRNWQALHFNNETILIKGARKFEFERISKLLTLKIHDTVLEINLNALAENLQFYRSKLKPGVKTMAMVKAFSYGSGSFEIANLLQYQKVDYLAVAYADEGIALRRGGISLPIMVMSPEPSAFEALVKYRLEPELYDVNILKSFINFLPDEKAGFKVHIKLDTGMHRLGFGKEELPELINLLLGTEKLKIESIFTHLVASDQAKHDDYTMSQILAFSTAYQEITTRLKYFPLKHVLNTSGITRWQDAQMDMVRIGIGLYGFDNALPANKGLQAVAVLKTTVTQVKNINAGETVGYGRLGNMPKGGSIATVKIGYADGYSRKFGNGVGKMLINGQLVPTIGSICMDMCMLDVTGIKVNIGDEVVVFNHQHTIVDLAEQIDTIPYEILTNVSQRVKRVYFFE
ncbi:bifunctional UDP-N-acetylmuramoyl-tripeptide:D-alanyl-D-alanine ligase/alanine racemase [Pedobacter insulae]|uniref:Alanine racemase n=1 Tax=Pedobacter insulae TaxID=414048 RepID=A0A1I2VIU5_9SPHI|nr:bifunctional UDP-N-acetylmuramoyl-tripeptide:D-alanyl-D-alanine ligase/alanine racemase [Pedobacter insulae]SFG89224.1 UDP-N-acetylmuramoyl-tripeptide--D-alanyl-D-alanine ligase [Pedobacter insulae]